MNPKPLPIFNKENLSNLTNSIKGSLGKSIGSNVNRFTNFVGGFNRVFKNKDSINPEDKGKKSLFGGLKGLFGFSKKSTTIFSTLKELSASTTSIKENVQKYVDIVDSNEESKREDKVKDDEFKAEVKNYLESILKVLGGKTGKKDKEEGGRGFLSGLFGLLGLTAARKFLQKMLGNFFKKTGMLIWEGISKYIISPLKNLINKALSSTKNLISKFLRWSSEKLGIKATEKTAEAAVKEGTKQTAEAAVKEGTKQTAEAAVKEGTKQTAEATVKEGTKQTAAKAVETATKESAEKVGETAVKEGAEKTAEVTAKAVSEQAAEATTKQAVESVAKTGTEAVAKGTTEAAVKGTTEAAVKETAEVTAKGATKGISKAAGVIAAPIVETAFAVYDYNEESAKLDQLEKEGLITAQEKEGRLNRLKGEKTGSAVGGTVGGIAGGAAVGAAIGSIVPGVGTLIGGLVGGIVGGIAGNMAGEAAGGAIADVTSENVLTDEEIQRRVEERRQKKEETDKQTAVETPKASSVESASAPKDVQDIKEATLKDTVPQQTNIVVNNVQGGSSTNVNNVNKAEPQESSVNSDNILAQATAGDLAGAMPG